VEGGIIPQNSELAGQRVNAFYISKFEVTWDEWQKVIQWGVNNGYRDLANVGQGAAGSHPVKNASWYDAVKWCNAKSEMNGLSPAYFANNEVYRTGEFGPEGSIAVTFDQSSSGYRLPTDAEWEWAARGGIKSKNFKYSGSNNINAVAWWYENSGGGTRPVGKKSPNELGIHDMSGNVWEWTWDFHDTDTRRCPRGGGWSYPPDSSNVAMRGVGEPDYRCDYIGFRLARTSK